MYPYGFSNSDKELFKIMKQLKKQGYLMNVPGQKSRELSKKITPIRKDFCITKDPKTKKSIIAKDPRVIINIKKNKRNIYYKFIKKL